MKRKSLAWFLTLCMVINLLTIAGGSAFAVEPRSGKPTVNLGDAIWTQQESSKFSYPNATVTYSENIYLLTVTSNKTHSVPDTVTVDGKMETAYLTDLNGMSSTWLYLTPKSAAEVQARIRALELTWSEGMEVDITVDGNLLQGFDDIENSGATLTQYNGHYYMFVPYAAGTSVANKTWNKAYNAAKSYVLGGMKGYLTTITSTDELNFLKNILAQDGAWCGGTAITTNSSGAVMNDPNSISDTQAANYYYRKIGGKTLAQARDGGTSQCTPYYYWACGPEAGQSVQTGLSNGSDFSFDAYPVPLADVTNNIDKNNSKLHYNEKGGDVTQVFESVCEIRMGWQGQINDVLPNYGSNYEESYPVKGYFVEFGGYTNDPGQLDKNKVVTVTNNQTPAAKQATVGGTVYTTVTAGFTALNALTSEGTLQLEQASGLTPASNQTLKSGYSVQSYDKNTQWTAKDADATVSVAADGKITLNSGALDVTVSSGQGKTTVAGYEVSSSAQYTVTAADENSPFGNGPSVTATEANQVITVTKGGKTYTYTAMEVGQTFYLGEYTITLLPETGSHASLAKPTGTTPENPYHMADYTFTLKPDTNYDLHSDRIVVKMGDTTLTQAAGDTPGEDEYTLTQQGTTGDCTITVPDVTGNIEVSVSYEADTPNEDRPVSRQMTEITVSGLTDIDGAAVGTYTATSAEDSHQTTYTPDESGKITVPRNAEVTLVFTPAAESTTEFSLLTSLKEAADDTELLDTTVKGTFAWDAHSYTYTYTPTDEADSFTAVFTPVHVVDVTVTSGSATFAEGVLESKGNSDGSDWSGTAVVANTAEAKLTFTTDSSNVFHRAWLGSGEDKAPVEGFSGSAGYTFAVGDSYAALEVEFHPGWTITVNTTDTAVENDDGAWTVAGSQYTQLVGPDSDLTIRFSTTGVGKILQSVTVGDQEISIYDLEQEDGVYSYTLNTIQENKVLAIVSDVKYSVLFYADEEHQTPLGSFVVANGGKVSQAVLDENQAKLTVPEGQSFYAWQDEYGTYYNANTIIQYPLTQLHPEYRDSESIVTGEDGTVITAEDFLINVSSLSGSLTAEQAKTLSGVHALKADGTAATAGDIQVSNTDSITGAGTYDVTFTCGQASITVQVSVIDTRPVVTGKTAYSLTFIGMPNTEYTVKKSDNSGEAILITTDANGKGVATGLAKATEYTISHMVYGSTTATTSLVDAADIAKQFTTPEDTTTSNGATDTTEKAWNSKVEVTVGEDGNYKVTVKDDINQTVQVPDTWGDVTVDLNGNNIKGPDATESTPAGPGIEFGADGGAAHPGTDLTIVDSTGSGKVQGGNGAAGTHPNGAPGVGTDAVGTPENAGITVGEGATIVGGNGADGSNDAASGGDGGAGIAGKTEVTVDGGTVIGGNGGNGQSSETNNGGAGGQGGAGIDTEEEEVAVNNGTVTGGNGGNGGSSTGETGTGGNGGNAGSGIDSGNGNTTITGGEVTGGNGGDGGSSTGETGTGGNGGNAGSGIDSGNGNTNIAGGEVTGGDGGDGGSSEKGEGGQGGNGGGGVTTGAPGTITVDKDGNVTGGDGGDGGSSEKNEGGQGGNGGGGTTGETENQGQITGGNGGGGGSSTEGTGGQGGDGGNGTTGETVNQGQITGGNGGGGGTSEKGDGGEGGNGGNGTTDDNPSNTDGNIQDGQGYYGELSATTNTVTVNAPKVGVSYTICDASGNPIADIAAQVAEAGKNITFTGLSPSTTYIVKASDGGKEITVGTISTQGTGNVGGVTIRYTIQASAGKGGSISPDGDVRVALGNSQTFHITPDEGYEIEDVLVDGKSVGAVSSYVFQNVRGNHTIEVVFAQANDPALPDVADPDDTGVSGWLNTKDHLAFMVGYETGLFGADRDMTRAEAAQLFYNLLLNKNVPITVSFTDVPADAWYATAVNTLASLGMIEGVGGGLFQPHRAITRAELTALATRFANGSAPGENIFSDITPDNWFYAPVLIGVQYGWITGYPDGTFRPNDTITRAEAATLTNRMLGRFADQSYVDQHRAELRLFPDVADTHWAFYQIAEASNSHDYTKTGGGEIWQSLD